MKITMLTGLSGPHFNLVAGDPHEPDDAEALRLIEAGFARAEDPAEMAAAIAARETEQAREAPALETSSAPAAATQAVRKAPATTRKKG